MHYSALGTFAQPLSLQRKKKNDTNKTKIQPQERTTQAALVE